MDGELTFWYIVKHMDICPSKDSDDLVEVAIACGGSRIAFLRI